MNNETTTFSPSLSTEKTRIAAVGASAGGLESLKSFFEKVPDETDCAYVIIQHLSSDHKSRMRELLEKKTALPIIEVTEPIAVESAHIYLVPPGNNLLLKEGKLHPVEKSVDQALNLPIDQFFESMAEEAGEGSIGIILSGTGSDGTRGARAIKEHDGMVMVQDPMETKFNGMPQSAINTGLVDYVLPAEQMGTELYNFLAAPAVLHFKDGEMEYDRSELMKILNFVDQRTGLDFREYKRSTLARRVARRVHVNKCRSLSEYLIYLSSNEEEVEILYREFLIGVTKFFRDTKMWKVLIKQVFPEMVRKKKDGDILKIWNVACSTGEEPYTYAMCLLEEIERQGKAIELKIFATDISGKHLNIGGKGIYPESIAADVPPELLVKYFLNKPSSFVVSEKLRSAVIFSKHNVIKNPPFSMMDLVSCRNLMIYFQPTIQQKALDFLHFSLRQDGILVLGTSESVETHKGNFEQIDRKWKIYRNILPKKRLSSGLSHGTSPSLIENSPSKPKKNIRPSLGPVRQKLGHEFNDTLLEHFNGASILVDSEYTIQDAIGEFRRYASLPVKGFTKNLLEMLETELRHLVQNSVRKAHKLQKKVYYKDALFSHQGRKRAADVIIKPFEQKAAAESHFMITFIEKEINLDGVEAVDTLTLTNRTQEYVSNLEEELKQTKEDLQTSLEEIETSNEELQAANEELLASNEELQSTNEELQSVNEEINTVNAENLQKMEDLEDLNADMNNLLESTQIGTIFLDADLKIRKFTPAIKEHFSLVYSDVGRPINHFMGHMGKNNLLERCGKVMETGKVLEKPIRAESGEHYLRRLSPYRNSKNKIKGVVITFIDISNVQRSKERLLASEKRYKSFYEEDPMMHLNIDPLTSVIVKCNKMTVKQLKYDSKDELIGRSIFDIYHEESQVDAIKSNKEFQEKGILLHLEQELKTKTGEIIPVILNATAEMDEHDNIITYRYTFADVTDLKRAEEQLKQQKADLQSVNRDLEQFVSICSHDLQEPLASIKLGSDILREMYSAEFDDRGKKYLTYIKNSSLRMSNQINALLEHSRIGRNGKMKTVDCSAIIEVVKKDMEKSINDTGAKIHFGELPKVRGYEVELRLLFQNLISNAIKYTPTERKPEVRITAYREGDFWTFSIVDNGIGIPEDDLKNIFTIFRRVKVNTTKDGTGVGLAHVEKIVQLHGGDIWVDSQQGVGSSFFFKLKA